MSTTTTNYNLKKPAAMDNYDIAVPNANMDIIDTQMKTNANAAASAATAAASAQTTADSAYAVVATKQDIMTPASNTEIDSEIGGS